MVDLKVVCCTIAVLLALQLHPVTSQAPSLFPYGSESADSLVVNADDGFTPGTQLSVPYVFYGTEYTTIYVNYNGPIAFAPSSSALSHSEILPHSSLSLIVPFWNDIDTNVGGRIWYRQSSSVSDLTRARDFLRDIVPVRFEPTQVFVATWDDVSEYDGHIATTNTFQAVLMTDGTESYSVFLYEQIEWGTSVTVGFNDVVSGNYYTWPSGANANSTDQQIQHATDLLTATNVDTPGVLVFRTDGLEIGGIPIATSEFFPYGNISGSYDYADGGADGFVGPLELNPPFLFLGVEQEQLYINRNGVISFGAPYTDCCPQDFPLPETTPPLIIPFWAGILNGFVYYHTETDSAVVEDVLLLLEYTEPLQFVDDLSFLLVITWDSANSFQAVLASDGTQSYVVFKYADAQWSGDAQIGFNDGRDPSIFYMLPGARNNGSLLELDSGSNTFPEIPGVYIFTVQHGGPPQEFTVASLNNSTSLTWSWLPPRGGVLTSYELSCLPLGAIPQPLPLELNKTVQSATIMELYPGVTYNCSIIAVSDTAIRRRSIPAIQTATTLTISPSGPPLGFLANNTGPRSAEFSWTAPDILLRNGIITGYTLTCAPLDGSQEDIVMMQFASEFEGPVELQGLSPDRSYECSVFASNSAGNGPNSTLTVRTSEDAILFQLRIKGLLDCLQWVHATDSSEKLADAISEIVEETEAICHCGLTETHISDAAFHCFSDSTQEVTFRAKLQGTSQTSAMQAATFLTEWIQNPDSAVIIQGVRLTIDILCPVLISSFAEEECTIPRPTSSSSVTGIVAGVVSVLILLVISGIVWIAVCFIARGKCAKRQPSEPVNINAQILRQVSTKRWRDDGAYELDGYTGSRTYDTMKKPSEEHDYASIPFMLPQKAPQVAFSLPHYTGPPKKEDTIFTEFYDDTTCKSESPTKSSDTSHSATSNSVYELDDQSKTRISQSPYELDDLQSDKIKVVQTEDLVIENACQSAYELDDQTDDGVAGIDTSECVAYGSYSKKFWADDPSYVFVSSLFENSQTGDSEPSKPQEEPQKEASCEIPATTQETPEAVNEELEPNVDANLGGDGTSADETKQIVENSIVEDETMMVSESEGGVPPALN